ncbi:MAG: 3-deoxy-manno-octulosonate cytidylyltransferase [Rhodospirillales bacterium]|nr:3-deoxy-manno-octulosonate cytidylyltransferase [Rhodospirillales bacterium]
MNPVVIIPARMASIRLPGKPLALIAGDPMIVHVLRRAQEANVGPVVVACGEQEIADAIINAGGFAVLTRPDHPSGSDRIWEALQSYDPENRHDVIINVQGDLPTIEVSAIKSALVPLSDPDVDISTLVAEITDPSERDNSNVVKAVTAFPGNAQVGRALYFSRATVPTGDGPLYHHIGLYAYRRAALERFVALPPGVLEQRERLEQLRALENGMRIDVALVDTVPFGVDTPADLERAGHLLAQSGR